MEHSRPRIAHIVDSMEVGGAETLVAQLSEWQRLRGFEVRIYCLKMIGNLGELALQDGFQIEVGRGLKLPRAALDAYRFMLRCKPDIVHCHNATATIVAAPMARLAHVGSIVSTRHGLVAPPHSIRREAKFGVAACCCDWIVAVCDAALKNLITLPFIPKSRVVRVYNGARRISFTPVHKGPDSGAFSFVHIGRLAPAKDQPTLLRAFAIAVRAENGLSLVIVGDGELRGELERLSTELGIDRSVSFVGEHQDVSPFLQNADAFVMSSVSEGVPVSLLEAMSVGLPVIVTNVGGMPEVISHGGAGIMVPPKNPEVLASAMLQLAHNPELSNRIGRQGLCEYEERFRPEIMAEQYNRLYHSNSHNLKGAAAGLAI
jgi:glycosyltransferase involved in cell wall biosynthesis